jgi:hypothetical protein
MPSTTFDAAIAATVPIPVEEVLAAGAEVQVRSACSACVTDRRAANRNGTAVSTATASSVPSNMVTSSHAGGTVSNRCWAAAL